MAISVRDTAAVGVAAPTVSGNGAASMSSDTTGNYIQNPPFDARLGQRGAVDSDGNFVVLPREMVQRGFIIQDIPQSDGKKYLVHFQFNPTSFTHSASLSAQIPTAGTPDQSGQGTDWMSFIANTGQAVQFSLLFDRTYELWQSDGQSFAGTQGCLSDIKTLYAMLGMYGANTAANNSPDTIASVDPAALAQTTPLSVMTGGDPVWVNFGSTLLSYYGIIQTLNVTFTHFTQKMIPVRAAVDIGLSVIPKKETRDSVPAAGSSLTWSNTVAPVDNTNYITGRQNHNALLLTKKGLF